MSTTVRAVYADGVLRPEHPLPFAEGEAVEVIVSRPVASIVLEGYTPEQIAAGVVGSPQENLRRALEGLPPEHAAALKRVAEAKSIPEWIAASEELAKFEPDDGSEYPDYLVNLDRDRRATGQRPLLPQPSTPDEGA
jgi:predicted DNA-binding antitoxin AbrB/MazE fold protein